MAKFEHSIPGGGIQDRDLLRCGAERQPFVAGFQTSPPALEATLAAISAEVMADALERLQRRVKT